MWTLKDLVWKLDYEGLEYFLTQINPDEVEDATAKALLEECIEPVDKLLAYMTQHEYFLYEEYED